MIKTQIRFILTSILMASIFACNAETSDTQADQNIQQPPPQATEPEEQTVDDSFSVKNTRNWDKVKDSTHQAWLQSKQAGQDIWDASKDTGGGLWQEGQALYSQFWDATKEGSQEIWSDSKETGSQLLKGVKEKSTEAIDSLLGENEEPKITPPSDESILI